MTDAQAGYELFDQPQEVIDLTFGVVTLLTAIVATLLGGLFIDMVRGLCCCCCPELT